MEIIAKISVEEVTDLVVTQLEARGLLVRSDAREALRLSFLGTGVFPLAVDAEIVATLPPINATAPAAPTRTNSASVVEEIPHTLAAPAPQYGWTELFDHAHSGVRQTAEELERENQDLIRALQENDKHLLATEPVLRIPPRTAR